MTPAGPTLGPFGEQQLRRVVRYLALAKLAVERGHSDRAQLRRLLTPVAYELQADPAITRFLGVPAPVPGDLGAMLVAVPGSGRVDFAVAARETAQRWGALRINIQLTAGGRLTTSELLRVQDHWLTVRQDPPSTVADLQQRMHESLAERQLARRAQEAAAARLANPTPTPRGPAVTERVATENRRWIAHLRRLDDELAGLIKRLDPAAARDPRHPPARLLGEEPPLAARAWDQWHAAYLELRHLQGWAPPTGLSTGPAGRPLAPVSPSLDL